MSSFFGFEVVFRFGVPFYAFPIFVGVFFFKDTDISGTDFNIVFFCKFGKVSGKIGSKTDDAVAGDDEYRFVMEVFKSFFSPKQPIVYNCLRIDFPAVRDNSIFVPFIEGILSDTGDNFFFRFVFIRAVINLAEGFVLFQRNGASHGFNRHFCGFDGSF